jgi:hypothetical protein
VRLLLVLAVLLAPVAVERPAAAAPRTVVASVQRTPAPSPTTTAVAIDGLGPGDTDDGTPLWFWIGLGVVVLLFAAFWIALLSV